MPRKTRMHLPPGACGTARKQPGCVLFLQRRVPLLSGPRSGGQGRFGVALHAYVLMTNHVHLLMTPRDTAGISRLMQHLGRHYFCTSTPVPAHRYAAGRAPQGEPSASEPISPCLYALHRIEPRGGGHAAVSGAVPLVFISPACLGRTQSAVEGPRFVCPLGANEHDRQCAYRELFRVKIPEVDIHNIRECLAYNHPLGNDRFREQVETTLGKCVGQRQRGRPPKHVDAPR